MSVLKFSSEERKAASQRSLVDNTETVSRVLGSKSALMRLPQHWLLGSHAG